MGAILSLAVGLVWAALCVAPAVRYGDSAVVAIGVGAAVLGLIASAAGAISALSERKRWTALAAALGFGLVAHAALAAGVAPRLTPLWLSQRVARLLDVSHLNPRDGLTPGPVTVVGFAEPSLVFILGTETELGDVSDAAEAISEGRPVVVEARQDAAFHRELSNDNLKASRMGAVAGLDYTTGALVTLIVYRSDSPPPADAGAD